MMGGIEVFLAPFCAAPKVLKIKYDEGAMGVAKKQKIILRPKLAHINVRMTPPHDGSQITTIIILIMHLVGCIYWNLQCT